LLMSAEEVKNEELPEGDQQAPAEEVAKVEEVEVKMGIDEFYPEDHVEKAPEDSTLSNRSMKFFECFGQRSYGRYNFHWLGDQDFIYRAGNTYQIYNTSTK